MSDQKHFVGQELWHVDANVGDGVLYSRAVLVSWSSTLGEVENWRALVYAQQRADLRIPAEARLTDLRLPDDRWCTSRQRAVSSWLRRMNHRARELRSELDRIKDESELMIRENPKEENDGERPCHVS